MAKDYYSTLGVDRSASKDDVKKAFRKLAQKHHPDKGGDEAKFKELSEAYSVLSDDKRRKEYDTYGQSAPGGAGPQGGGFNYEQYGGFGQGGVEFDLNDLFGDFFGGSGRRQQQAKRGRDVSVDIEIPFKDSILGAERSIRIAKVSTCETCKGSGAKPGTQMDACKTCNGAGRIEETRNTVFGPQRVARACQTCDGTGKIPKEKCETCKGHGVHRREEEIKVTLPGGLENGETLRMPGKGEAVKGGASGDLYINVHVKPHALFRKEGMNLVMDLSIKISDALLGTTASIKAIDDKTLDVKVPPLSGATETLRVRGKGVAGRNGNHGDLLIHISVALPKKLSSRSKKAIEELKEEGL